jgi:hypothetical protein
MRKEKKYVVKARQRVRARLRAAMCAQVLENIQKRSELSPKLRNSREISQRLNK